MRELAEENASGQNILVTAFRFSACAGMGAVYLWHTNWTLLQRKGIVEALESPRGLENMDEYVTDIIGIGWGTKKSDDLVEHLHLLVVPLFVFWRRTKKSLRTTS